MTFTIPCEKLDGDEYIASLQAPINFEYNVLTYSIPNSDSKNIRTPRIDSIPCTSPSHPIKGKHIARSCLRVKSHKEALETKGLRCEPEKSESVCFSYLEVREYPIILGDNPSCRDGPPITIDWKYDPSTKVVLDIDVFEKLRGYRRLKVELLMPRTIRERCILRAGYSSKDVAKAMRQLRREKHSRAVSILQTGMDDFNEVKEKVAQGFKKLLCPKATDELLLMEGFVLSHTQSVELLPNEVSVMFNPGLKK